MPVLTDDVAPPAEDADDGDDSHSPGATSHRLVAARHPRADRVGTQRC